jgi:hypothetical protein
MLKVIGAGFGRTGTHSLAEALEILGFGPCYHLREVGKNPDHTELWNAAIDGKALDWDRLYANYRSAVEWPTVAFLPQLVAHYPDAKVILSLRDPEAWYDSAQATIFAALELSQYNPDLARRTRSAMPRHLILEKTFAGRYWDKAYAIQVYQQHVQHVKEMVPTERLLPYEITDGWAPLCTFLNVPVPNQPFPRTNERVSFVASKPEWAKQFTSGHRDVKRQG